MERHIARTTLVNSASTEKGGSDMKQKLLQWLRPMAGASLLVLGFAYLGAGTKFETNMAGRAQASSGVCSLETVKGPYAEYAQGTIVGQFPGLPPPPLLLAESGLMVSDGAGSVSGQATVSLNGTIFPVTITGTYTVNSDCTYSDVVTTSTGLVLHDQGTITGGGILQEVHVVETDPGTVITRTFKHR